MERFRVITAIIWLFIQMLWVSQDNLIRDGDEEGHVGAAELIKEQLNSQGWFSLFPDAFWGNLGEYPPLYASLLGIWWNIVASQPEEVLCRLFGSLLLLCTAFFTSNTIKNHTGDGQLAFLLVLCLPLWVGISRHFMIENLVLTCTAFALWSTSLTISDWKKGILFGVAFALGMLTKQTFIIVGIGMFLFLPLRAVLSSLPIIILLCLGWYFPQWTDQGSYLTTSVSANSSAHWGWHLLAPFFFLLLDLCGPIIGGCLIAFLFRKKTSKKARLFIIWIAISIALFILIPKKYPRLMIALPLPCILLLCEQFDDQKWNPSKICLATFASIWMLLGSNFSLPHNPIHTKIDSDRCPQRWLRPAFGYDLGLQRIANATKTLPLETNIAILSPPPIPCSIQTTHPFPYHLEIYLRRHQIENPIRNTHTDGDFLIQWNGPISHPSSLQLP